MYILVRVTRQKNDCRYMGASYITKLFWTLTC